MLLLARAGIKKITFSFLSSILLLLLLLLLLLYAFFLYIIMGLSGGSSLSKTSFSY